MKVNYFSFFLIFILGLCSNAQVGIGTTTPTAKLDVVSNQASGNALRVTDNNTSNASPTIWVRNLGSGACIYNELIGSGVYGVYNNLDIQGGIGSLTSFAANDGTGYMVEGIDGGGNGGDVFAFKGEVNTSTASTSSSVYGSVFSGEQYGEGHGIIINHSGVSGRNAEFNVSNSNNTNAAIFTMHAGQGSSIVARNQNSNLSNSVLVGDFAYTGTDIDDHIGVSGVSVPVSGFGIGVLGNGGFYGLFSDGDLGATGTKTFLIDHPEDPENKMLRHFSIESNEVLNMYRGTAIFDTNGRAIVVLPSYYENINRNPSYQLTPIGASMPNIFIESEINDGQFVIAGGAPGKKVSWQITAERNDLYMQQDASKREVVVKKEGERKGKYLNPELYNKPLEKGLFYNTQLKNSEAKKVIKDDVSESKKE